MKTVDDVYEQIKQQSEEQLDNIEIDLDHQEGMVFAIGPDGDRRKIPVGILPKDKMEQLTDQIGVKMAMDETVGMIVPEIVKATKQIFTE